MQRSLKAVARAGAKSAFAAADVFRSTMPGPRILIYHQIDAGLGRQMEVTLDRFRWQLDWLEEHGRLVSLDEAIGSRSADDADRLFVVSFDDGYRDIYEKAWPLLKQRSAPFTIYLTTDPTESGVPLTEGGRAEPLEWAHLEEMLASGLMTIGAHTHRHLDLRHLDGPTIEDEIGRSNGLILERLGVDPRHFAYPWGYWDADADEVVRRAYSTAVLGSGPPISPESNLHRLHRVPIQLSDSSRFFTTKMTTGMRLEDVVRRRVARYNGP